jgi:hypothetical protein
MLYGVPVVLTANTPAPASSGFSSAILHTRALVHAKAALQGATSNGIRIQEKDSESLKKVVIGDLAYGVATLNAKAGVKILAAGDTS